MAAHAMSTIATRAHPADLAGFLALPGVPERDVAASGERIVALDGLRGVLAGMVVVSHYFGEVPHGFKAALLGWIAVKMFFVLSGFLMARVIADHLGTPGFFRTFYVRRACRTLPVYLVTLAIVLVAAHIFAGASWMEAGRIFPLWSYLTFTQTFEMVAHGDFGLDWLTPTWTLTVEEQFYLAAPVFCLLVGRRHLLGALVAAALASVAFRWLAYGAGAMPTMAAQVLLPGVAHAMVLGMIAALVLRSSRIDWSRFDFWLRAAPIVILGVVFALKWLDGGGNAGFQLVGVPLVAVACAVFLMAIVRGAPEARRMMSPVLRELGQLSFAIYLLHMPVLGLLHGLVLGGRPDIATSAELAVTLAAIPLTLLLATAVNRTIEQPMIAFGRRWRFASARR